MSAYVCMLRSVNVGGKNAISMRELRTLFESLDYAGVVTYIQSGNVVFQSDRRDASGFAQEIEGAMRSTFGLGVPAIVRSGAELAGVLARNPLNAGGRDTARLYITFLNAQPDPRLVAALDGYESAPDEFVVAGREVYLHCPAGYGNTKLNNTFWERRFKVTATARNLSTVGKLAQMAGG